GRQRRRARQLHALARQGQREVDERREAEQGIVHAAGEDLPATLMTEDVVELLADLALDADDVAHALRQREGLVDQRALAGGEQLARELRERAEVVALGGRAPG